MLNKENIICISSIDWDFVWQGHQEIMSAFAREGNRVLFIENTGIRMPTFKDIPRLKKRFINWLKSVKGFRQERKNLFIYSPLVLPFPYSRVARWINKFMLLLPLKRWMKITEFKNPLVWTFLPTGIALDIINSIDKKLLVYYCIADFYELADSPKKVKKTENDLIKKSDLIFAQGAMLKEKCRHLNDNVHIFPFGVKMEIFENFKQDIAGVADDIKDIKKPIIGYVGGVHRHIDFNLIRFIARANPEWSVVLVGPIQTGVSAIADLKNVFLLGKKDFTALADYINQFDVGIVPYVINGYTKTVYPTKLNEYHAMGKPVVSTNLPEVASFNAENDKLVLMARTYKEFVDCIYRALHTDDVELTAKRRLSARRNSWAERIEKMSGLLEQTMGEKPGEPLNWQESFIKFYRTSRRKALKFCVAVLSTYLLIFYTPLVWLMAGPLKISQAPRKADSIVVFAGGVGESGKAGQGFEERVEYAVELYKKGYADYMIFSSGYMYVFEEPLVMKALAVSLGVPDKAIVLEDRAANTYENVKFTKEILTGQGWDKALLVSSPYHMRRIALVANKIAPEIEVIYTPIPQSLFYSHPIGREGRLLRKQVNLQQIKAVLHEYLGIIYYWWKKYI